MRTPSIRMLADSCVVYAPPAEAFDSEGGSSLQDGDPSPALRCMMSIASGKGFTRRGEAVPMGVATRKVVFASDPGVSVADQKLVVTTRGGTVFTLRSTGPTEDPYGIQHCWNVYADLKV